MKRLPYLLLISGMALTVLACDNLDSQPETLHTDASLTGTQWEFVGFRTNGSLDTDLGWDIIEVQFEDSDTLKGNHLWADDGNLKGKNSYQGIYLIDDNSLQISDLVSTYVGYSHDSRMNEYSEALNKTHSYEIQNNQLSLYYGEDNNTLIFKSVEID